MLEERSDGVEQMIFCPVVLQCYSQEAHYNPLQRNTVDSQHIKILTRSINDDSVV